MNDVNAHCPYLTSEQYHKRIDHDGSTMLRAHDQSPFLYEDIKSGLSPPPTDYQRLGTLQHILTIERERAHQLVAIIPADVLAKVDGKVSPNGAKSTNAYKEWEAEQVGKLAVKQAEYDREIRIADRVLKNPTVRAAIARCTLREHSIFWNDGHPLKCRLDLADELVAEVLDVKRTESIDTFWKSVERYSYDAQGGLYADGFQALFGEPARFGWLLISPHGDSCVRHCPPKLLQAGREKNARTIANIKAHKFIKEGYEQEMDLEYPQRMLPESGPTDMGVYSREY